jgi:hypothetical protein
MLLPFRGPNPMRNAIAIADFATALGLILASPALSADVAVSAPRSGFWRGSMVVHQLPYPRSERAAAVWDERSCWSECGSSTAWDMAACLRQDAQGQCLKFADHADRSCQRQCRTAGGPFVPDIFDSLE